MNDRGATQILSTRSACLAALLSGAVLCSLPFPAEAEVERESAEVTSEQ